MSKAEEVEIDTQLVVGQLVEGSDFNAASSLLYRWWGIFEAPASVDIDPFLVDMFDADVEAKFLDPVVRGADALISKIKAGPTGLARSHHIDDKDIRLTYLGEGLYRLEAEFSFQTEAASTGLQSGRARYDHTLKKRPDGRLVFATLNAKPLGNVSVDIFRPSYIRNRAKAIIIQFQTHMDSLSGDASGLRELMMPEMELHGLIASSTDDSQKQDETVTDLKNMKKSIAGGGPVKENIIRTYEQLAEWFATGPSLFKYGLHLLEELTVKPLAEGRYEVMAQFEWKAETLNGAKIELHQPLTWVVVDQGEKYMRIEKLLPPN
nr:hypothetical protein [uncultured Hyphomonas sp.]